MNAELYLIMLLRYLSPGKETVMNTDFKLGNYALTYACQTANLK